MKFDVEQLELLKGILEDHMDRCVDTAHEVLGGAESDEGKECIAESEKTARLHDIVRAEMHNQSESHKYTAIRLSCGGYFKGYDLQDYIFLPLYLEDEDARDAAENADLEGYTLETVLIPK